MIYVLWQVATWVESLGIVPSRFSSLDRGMDRMFSMCRGIDGAEALSKYMTYKILLLSQIQSQIRILFHVSPAHVLSNHWTYRLYNY